MTNLQADPYHRGSVLSRSFLPLALITLGVVFLLSNLIPERGRGGLVVLGLGAAFLVGRVTTGRYGYAVPAGILLALGTFISLQELQTLQGVRGGGPFFVLLGLGFALVYLIGSRPGAVWPVFPAAVMIGLGLVLFGAASFGTLASLSWIVAYWPAALDPIAGQSTPKEIADVRGEEGRPETEKAVFQVKPFAGQIHGKPVSYKKPIRID